MKKFLLFVLLALGAFAVPAKAQQASSAFIVSSCGTLPAGVTYAAGQFGILTMDTTGKFCDSATGGGGGGAVTIADGADVTLGAKADAVCGTSTGTCTLQALIKFLNAQAVAQLAATQAPVPPQSPAVPIGGTGICDGANGTTNPCTTVATVKAPSAAAVATDKPLVVTIIPGATTGLGAVGTPVRTDPTGTTSQPVSLSANVTPTACGGTVVTGNTAVNAFTAQSTLHGFTIANIDTSEVLWISFTTTALASDVGSYPLGPATATTFAGLSSYSSPPGFGMNTALSVVAATDGHKFSCTRW